MGVVGSVRLAVVLGLLGATGINMAAMVSAEPFVMERTDVRSMTSAEGAQYRIYVHRPAAPPPASGYPVLYLLDGDDSFPVAAQTAERMARFGGDEGYSGVLIVGIGYAPEDMVRRRVFDYTPATTDGIDPAGRPSGGSDQFRRFLAEKLKSAISEEFAVDRDRESIWGHSYGGLLVIDTLLREPALFDTYVATSPAIWFGDQAVLKGISGFAQRLKSAGPRVLALSVGELEQSATSTAANYPAAVARRDRLLAARMIDASRELAEALSPIEGLSVHHRVTTGEDHAATPLSGIAQALQLASGKDLP